MKSYHWRQETTELFWTFEEPNFAGVNCEDCKVNTIELNERRKKKINYSLINCYRWKENNTWSIGISMYWIYSTYSNLSEILKLILIVRNECSKLVIILIESYLSILFSSADGFDPHRAHPFGMVTVWWSRVRSLAKSFTHTSHGLNIGSAGT